MLFLRTAGSDFIDAATIVRLIPERDEDGDQITGWVAIVEDGREIALAAYYSAPGRIEPGLRHLIAPHRDLKTAAGCECGLSI